MKPDDKFTNTVEDAAEYERWRQGGHVPSRPKPRPQQHDIYATEDWRDRD